MIRHVIYLILLTTLVLGCTVEGEVDIPEHLEGLENLTVFPADARPAKEIHLVEDHIFEDTGEVLFGGIIRALVDEAGRVFVLDSRQSAIHIFQHDGTYVTSFGRQGEGPGEFSGISPESTIVANQLFIYDSEPRRITVFSLASFEPSHILTLSPERWSHINQLAATTPNHYFVRSDKSLLIGFVGSDSPGDAEMESYIRYYVMDWEGAIVSDKVLELRGMKYLRARGLVGITFPFFRESLVALSEDGRIFSAWTEDFLIKVHSPEGEYLRAFYYPFRKSALDRREMIARYDDVVSLLSNENPWLVALRDTEIPETWPALNSMHFDDENRLWVSTIVDDEEVYEWWVLEDSGELVGRFTLPRDSQIDTIKNGYVYAREVDSDTGLQRVVRYRIEMEPSEE